MKLSPIHVFGKATTRPAGLGQSRAPGSFAPLGLMLPVLLLCVVAALVAVALLIAAFYACLGKWLLQVSMHFIRSHRPGFAQPAD